MKRWAMLVAVLGFAAASAGADSCSTETDGGGGGGSDAADGGGGDTKKLCGSEAREGCTPHVGPEGALASML